MKPLRHLNGPGMICLIMAAFSAPLTAQEPERRGPYLGQEPPGTTPEVFGPGFFTSYATVHGRLTFSPDGQELYWAANAAPVQSRWHMAQGADGIWSLPQPSWLSLEYSENGLSFSPDGQRAYFHSRRASAEGGSARDMNLWYRERQGSGWGDPVNLGSPVNTPSISEFQPTLTNDGFLYFTREGEGGSRGSESPRPRGESDLYVSRLTASGYSEPVVLGPEINSDYHEIEPAVAPDHSYLVFTSTRPGGFSPRINLYVSFRMEDGSWTQALDLSEIFRLDNIWFPSISSDGRYLFFCDAHYTEDGIVGDYYWVDTRVIEELRPGHPS